jgi:uncharacterized BrkB/YihY/UPF0761 family membrane protein
MSEQVAKPSRHHIWRITLRTLSKSWDDSIFSESAQAGFWSALSLPPLLLGMLGTLAYVAPLFGPDMLPSILRQLISTAHSVFSPSVVNEIIEPTVRDIANNARGEVVSLGFIISLWAGSSAISAFVDSVVEAHDQTPLRHPVRQRLFALFLYVVGLIGVVMTAPLIVLGPRKIGEHIPVSLANVLRYGYYPALILVLMVGVVILYRVSLPEPLPTHRLIFGAGHRGVRHRHFGSAHLPAMDHQHRLHLRRALHTHCVLALLVLRRLRDHDRRRTQCRHSGRVPRAADACAPAAQVAAVALARAGEGGRHAVESGDDESHHRATRRRAGGATGLIQSFFIRS